MSNDDLSTLRDQVKELDKTAFTLAKERWNDGTLTKQRQAEAEEAQAELRRVARTLRSNHEGAYESMSETISEALLDFKFAINGVKGVSLRMNQFMDEHAGRR